MKKQLSRRNFVKDMTITSASVVAAVHGVYGLEPVSSTPTSSAICNDICMMKHQKSRNDGLCKAEITIRPFQLLSTVCILGGAKCPFMEAENATYVLNKVKTDPTITIRLESNVDVFPHFTTLKPIDHASPDTQDVLNRKRDLDVLQRLGLAPGDTRRARYLYELLFNRISTPAGICAYNTPGWEGCSLAYRGAYEHVYSQGWKSVVYDRPDKERADYRRRNIEQIKKDNNLFIRPHLLLCLSCWYGSGEEISPRPDDTLFEILQRIQSEPDVPITLIEGTCTACECCDGFHPATKRCVHSGGLIRDFKKDLDCFQKLGLMPGATLKAQELFSLLFERIPSTRDICAYGDGIIRSNEWAICGNPDGSPGYTKTRLTGIF